MKYLVIIILFFTCNNLSGSDLIISYSQGFAQTSHEDLKNLNNFFVDYSKRTNDLDLKIVDNYPDFYYLQFELKYKTEMDIFAGVGLKTFSSGARLNYSDFSGEVKTDFFSNSKVFYLLGQYDYRLFKYFSISPFVHYDLIFSELEMVDYVKIYEESQKSTLEFFAISNSITIGTDLLVVIDPVQFGIKASYMLDLNGFILSGNYENEDMGIVLTGEKIIQAKWGGYRIGFIVSVVL